MIPERNSHGLWAEELGGHPPPTIQQVPLADHHLKLAQTDQELLFNPRTTDLQQTDEEGDARGRELRPQTAEDRRLLRTEAAWHNPSNYVSNLKGNPMLF